ncbi:hypothetical protein QBC34DRAFT_294079 [Podospora aff. communis PSN243]|uniref:Uncharacterized protein n=1 Tax=Podospora aff. communis PSN243 TaxID=3040156 RepID=A0AAV9GWG7_9PEZI|nr:hypothetical protein QBC34DRAFT_294079 [Podospora aff. communis PSN243]
MSGLPAGAFLTTLGGRRCTAVPRAVTTTSAAPAAATVNADAAAPPAAAAATTAATEPTSATETSETDSNITAAAADVVNTPAAGVPDASSPILPENPGATNLISTLGNVGIAQAPTDGPVPGPSNTATSNSAVSAGTGATGNSVQSTVAVAGGVIGGVVALSIAAFVIWWWRRRVIKKRRSTLLTPLDAANYRDEKGGYMISRGSIGPTPMGEKFKAALGYNAKKIRGRMSRLVTKKGSSPSVNMDRGTSQFMDPTNSHSRATSSNTIGGAEVTAKDRFVDWWSRLTADMNFNWRTRDNGLSSTASNIGRGIGNNDISAYQSTLEKRDVNNAQPDFLTLLNMDERELDREAQRRRASLSRKNGSAGSTDQFLGRLNLSFGSDDPFSDANALAHTSAQPAPLTVSQGNNPFSDANAIREPKPSTYVAEMRRSRGQSVSNNGGPPSNTRQPSTVYQRDSGGSVSDFAGRRNKFRSDPFDLERPELLAGARAAKNSITSSTGATAGGESRSSRISGGVGTGEIRRPAGAHHRGESFTSKYSSGVSMGDWSDPGPDVGPAASRWDGPEPRGSPTQGWRDRLEREQQAGKAGDMRRNDSVGSGKSVGKAM